MSRQLGGKDLMRDAARLRPLMGAGGGTLVHKVKVSGDDTTADWVENKVAAGTGLVATVLNEGGDEVLEIAFDALILVDRTTGTTYELFVNNGKLWMEEV